MEEQIFHWLKELVNIFGPNLVFFGVVIIGYFYLQRKGSVIVFGNNKPKINENKNGNGSDNKIQTPIFSQALCDRREQNCLERFANYKEKIEEHDTKLEKGDEEFKKLNLKVGYMHGDIKQLLRAQNLKSLQEDG